MQTELITSLVALFGALVSIVTLAYKFGKFSNSFNLFSERLAKLEQGQEKHNEELVILKAFLSTKYRTFNALFNQKHSPTSLNDLGEKLFEAMHGKEFLEKNKEAFFTQIDKQQPKTAWDVELASNLACVLLCNEELFNPIKDFLFQAPLIDDGRGGKTELTMENACNILSFPLRDMYLEEHKQRA